MDNVDLKTYLPDIYEGVVEMETLQDALSTEINSMNTTYETASMDQFVQYASLQAIEYYESIFHITANPYTETLQQRRDRILNRMKSVTPPYTEWYLRTILDGILGVGNYILDIDNDTYTITLENSVENSFWYHEIDVTMTSIKPCNMIYINKPLIDYNLFINEEISQETETFNYKLNNSWLLGLRPFVSISPEEIVKMPNVPSVQQPLITSSLQNISNIVDKVKLNDSIIVTILTKSVTDSMTTISYEISDSVVQTITNIKLLDSSDNVLCDSNVFIPVSDYVIIKHRIKVEENVNDQ